MSVRYTNVMNMPTRTHTRTHTHPHTRTHTHTHTHTHTRRLTRARAQRGGSAHCGHHHFGSTCGGTRPCAVWPSLQAAGERRCAEILSVLVENTCGSMRLPLFVLQKGKRVLRKQGPREGAPVCSSLLVGSRGTSVG